MYVPLGGVPMVCDVVTVPEALRRAKADGIPLSGYSLRRLVKGGQIPARYIGPKALVSYSAVLRYLACADGCDNAPGIQTGAAGVRRIDVG